MNNTTRLGMDLWDFGDLVLKSRVFDAIRDGTSRYPIFRSLRFAAREDVLALFDRIATQPGWHAQRLRSAELLIDAEGLFMTVHGSAKPEYCSCGFSIWADSVERAEAALARISALVADTRMNEPMFSIDWHFITSKGQLESAEMEELADDRLLDSAYPEIPSGVDEFVRRYLASQESVLVVQGPPGTGKTRLIRAILGAMSRQRGRQARALYTGDTKSLESDEIFVKFITGWEDAFVVEDADHLLKPRAEGNEHLHRFLTIADGVVRSQGRKIVFSTNLPNVGDLDDALIRPGRCFARLNCRELTHAEAGRVVLELSPHDVAVQARAQAAIAAHTRRTLSLATVYSLVARAAEPSPAA